MPTSFSQLLSRREKIDYQQKLRDIAKSMVRLKRPERLLKLITRFIDRELGLSHTSLLVRDEKRQRFIFVDSKGRRRFPLGLLKIDADDALVRWFEQGPPKIDGIKFRDDCLDRRVIEQARGNKRWKTLPDDVRQNIDRVAKAMEDFKAHLAVPGYFKDSLIGLLLLGKKTDGRRFTDSEIAFFEILTQDCSMAVKTAEYHQSIIAQNKELGARVEEIEKLRKKERETYYQIMRSLAQEVYEKDNYTFGHVTQVERLGIMTAKEMGLNLTGRDREVLCAGLILHDVGKIGIPDHILKKPGSLNQDEWKVMKTHVEKGAKILEHLSDFKEALEIVRCHHENFDGSGYPRGLKGDRVPLFARIVSVVDAFHAIVSTRCYSKGRPAEAAFEELKRCAGTQFDPVVVDAFIRAMKREMKKRGVGFFLDELTDGSQGQAAALGTDGAGKGNS